MVKDNIKYVIDSSPDAKKNFFAQMPKKLYKYRVWENDFHKTILIKSELYFSSSKRFNDPYDCGLPYRQDPQDLDVEIIKRKLEQYAPRMFPHLAHDKLKLEEECARQLMLIMQGPEEYFQNNYGYRPEDLSEMFGVLCLTPHPFNILMWSHYSDSHKGFVVGFNTEELVTHAFGQFKRVDYTDEIPVISIFDDRNNMQLTNKLIYTKSTVWKYEDEYRITKILGADTKSNFTNDAIATIHLGYSMPLQHRWEIIEITKQNFPHVEIYEMRLNSEKFILEEFRIF